jgi:hypothetical protein
MTDLRKQPKRTSRDERAEARAERTAKSRTRRRDQKITALHDAIERAKLPKHKALLQRLLERHMARSQRQTRAIAGSGLVLKRRRDVERKKRSAKSAPKPKVLRQVKQSIKVGG